MAPIFRDRLNRQFLLGARNQAFVTEYVTEMARSKLIEAGTRSGASIAEAAMPWLRIAILGVPAILMSAAGNGWMRGVQDTMRPLRYVLVGFGLSAVLCPLLVYGWLGLPRLELAGSAVANLVGQWLAAVLFCRALLVEKVPLRLDISVLRAQVVMGRDLVLRTLAFQACFVSAGAVAARFGAAALAARAPQMAGNYRRSGCHADRVTVWPGRPVRLRRSERRPAR